MKTKQLLASLFVAVTIFTANAQDVSSVPYLTSGGNGGGNDGDQGTYYGHMAGKNTSSEGIRNCFIGNYAGINNLNGSQNVFLGSEAGATPSYYVGSIERALNGKLYITYAAIQHQTHLAVLNDPDNPLNPGFQASAIDLSPAYQNGYTNLPQWVHRHGTSCEDHTVLSIPEGNISHTYQYANYIQAENNYKIVSSLQDITMLAGNHIVLKPDVYIANGTHYLGRIEDCGINQQRLAIALCQESQSESENEPEERSAIIAATGLQVYPNPTTGLISFTGIQINEIYIFDLLGKDVCHSRFDNAYTASADISTLQKGIYMAKVIDSEGLIKTVKIIKE